MTHRSTRTGPRRVITLMLALTLVGSVLGGTLGATPSSATDDPTDNGLWYFTGPDLATVHQRTTGEGIKVAVLDGPINPAAPDLGGAKNLITLRDSFCEVDGDGPVAPAVATTEIAEHATEMASLIVGTGVGTAGQPGTLGVAPGATVLHYAVKFADLMECNPEKRSGIAPGIDQAVTDGAKIISISLAGSRSPKNNAAIGRAERAGVIVVVSSNNRGGTELGWPASANGVVSVEGATADGNLLDEAVTSPLLSVVAPGDSIRRISWSEGRWDTYKLSYGSSFATAWTSGVLALVWSAYPDATANQIIQTLLRNNGHGHGELVRDDSWGYGFVSVNTMLEVDPTTYPDVNPLLRKDADAQPAYSDVVAPATPTPTSGAGEAATPPSGADESGLTHGLLITGAALLVLIGIVLVVVLTRRNRTERTTQRRPVQ